MRGVMVITGGDHGTCHFLPLNFFNFFMQPVVWPILGETQFRVLGACL
jgi:hypothetical protein